MNLHAMREIAQGFMAPRSEAINVFAQTGRVRADLVAELRHELVTFGQAYMADLYDPSELAAVQRDLERLIAYAEAVS